MRIGIDIGQHTTTVAIVRDGVLGACFTGSTGPASVGSLLHDAVGSMNDSVDEISAVMVATSQIDQALADSRFMPTAAIRLAAPPSESALPFHDWPAALAAKIGAPGYQCTSGTGRLAALEAELINVCADIRRRGIRSAALTGQLSPANPREERWASGILRRANPDLQVTLSHSLGPIGLLERENATIFNASLIDVINRLADDLENSVRDGGIRCPIYLTRYDGTVGDLDYIRAHPFVILGGRRAAAARGASVISGLTDCLVLRPRARGYSLISVRNGYPTRSDSRQEVHGVRTSMPHLDVRHVDLERPWSRAKGEDRLLLQTAEQTHPLVHHPVVLLTDRPRILSRDGSSLRHRHLSVPMTRSITALGAASAEIGGECDRLLTAEADGTTADVITESRVRAVAAGAVMGSLRNLEVAQTTVSYLGGRATRVLARVVGDVPTHEKRPIP